MKLDWEAFRGNDPTTVIKTIDYHIAGEPFRIIVEGVPNPQGKTILERRRFFREHFDHLRRALIWEPRGHYNMYGCVLMPPVTQEASFGVLFLHNEGYSTMCGHGIIGLVTALIETGTVEAKSQKTPIHLDTPAGLVRATAHLEPSGRVEHVSFLNVPSFLYAKDVEISLPDHGPLTVDVAFGGAFYAILPAERIGLTVDAKQTEKLVIAGKSIKQAVNKALSIQHPDEEDLGFLYGTILTGPPEDPSHHSRNICVFADAEVDRSPTGTGISARLAQHYAKGEVGDAQEVIVESILGRSSTFTGKIVGHGKAGPYPAIVPEVSGKAFLTGKHEFIVDRRDELGRGFLI
jgi:proline racemase